MAKVDETAGSSESDVQTENAARQAELAVPAEVAADSVGDYFRASLARVKAGESGVLPVVAGMILISILFQSLDDKFLTAGNLVNLLVQAAVFSLLAMGQVFVLLLGEIDLSVGFVAGLGGVIMRQSPPRSSPARESACSRARSSRGSAYPPSSSRSPASSSGRALS